MSWSVWVESRAQSEILRLTPVERERVLERIERLAENPFAGAVKLKGADPPLYRVRVGDYRVLFAVDGWRRLVLVTHVRHRREVYR